MDSDMLDGKGKANKERFRLGDFHVLSVQELWTRWELVRDVDVPRIEVMNWAGIAKIKDSATPPFILFSKVQHFGIFQEGIMRSLVCLVRLR